MSNNFAQRPPGALGQPLSTLKPKQLSLVFVTAVAIVIIFVIMIFVFRYFYAPPEIAVAPPPPALEYYPTANGEIATASAPGSALASLLSDPAPAEIESEPETIDEETPAATEG